MSTASVRCGGYILISYSHVSSRKGSVIMKIGRKTRSQHRAYSSEKFNREVDPRSPKLCCPRVPGAVCETTLLSPGLVLQTEPGSTGRRLTPEPSLSLRQTDPKTTCPEIMPESTPHPGLPKRRADALLGTPRRPGELVQDVSPSLKRFTKDLSPVTNRPQRPAMALFTTARPWRPLPAAPQLTPLYL